MGEEFASNFLHLDYLDAIVGECIGFFLFGSYSYFRIQIWLNVCLNPETLRRTTFGFKKEGDFVNFEIEAATKAIVDSYDRMRGGR